MKPSKLITRIKIDENLLTITQQISTTKKLDKIVMPLDVFKKLLSDAEMYDTVKHETEVKA
jgi:hypothetical protein